MEQISLQSLAESQLATYQDNDMAILRNIHEIQDIPSDNILLNSFMFAVVTQGNAQICVDDHVYNLEVGDVFVSKPERILKKSMFSMDFDVFVVLFHSNYVDRVVKDLGIGLEIQLVLSSFDIIHCDQDELNHMKMYGQLIQDKLNNANSPNRKKSIDTLFYSMLYELKDVHCRTEKPVISSTLSSGKNILERFFKILNDKSQPYLNVGGYADKLNISPKYFSNVCKKHTGKTASQLINEEIIHTAQIRLKDSQYSIQQIARMLGFANQSHFGVFFHRHTGLAPQKYRTQP